MPGPSSLDEPLAPQFPAPPTGKRTHVIDPRFILTLAAGLLLLLNGLTAGQQSPIDPPKADADVAPPDA